MKTLLSFTLIVLAVVLLNINLNAQEIYTVRPSGSGTVALHKINIATGKTISQVSIVKDIHNITGFRGMAVHPTSKVIYALAQDGPAIHYLVTINPTTGKVTEINEFLSGGSTVDGLAFDQTGNLYTRILSKIYKIDISTAAKTEVASISLGSEVGIAYNPTDNRLYIAGDNGRLARINLVNGVSNIITTALPDNFYAIALTYRAGTNDFIYTTADDIYKVETDGSNVKLSTEETQFGFKGLFDAQILTSARDTKPVQVKFDIYPNPAENMLYIEKVDPAENESHTGRIYNALGEVMGNEFLLDRSRRIDISGFPNGVYFISLTNSNGISMYYKIVKL